MHEELINRELVTAEVSAWMQAKAQERHDGDVLAFIAEVLTQEHIRDQHRRTPEQRRENARKYSEYMASLPPGVLEELAGFEEVSGRGALKRAEDLRRRAAEAGA